MSLHGSLLIYQPHRDGRQSWHTRVTHSGKFSHKVVTCKPKIGRKFRESSPAVDSTSVIISVPTTRRMHMRHNCPRLQLSTVKDQKSADYDPVVPKKHRKPVAFLDSGHVAYSKLGITVGQDEKQQTMVTGKVETTYSNRQQKVTAWHANQ